MMSSQISIVGSSLGSTQSLDSIERNGGKFQAAAAPVTKKKTQQTSLFNYICEHLTTVSHVCIVGVTIYLVYLSSLHFEFFNWHPILFSIGWMLLMTEAVLMLTKDNVLSSRITYTMRVRYHWILQVIAVACCIGGFIVVFLYEEGENNPHFRTNHGIYGLVAIVFAFIPTCLSGLPALFNISLRQFIPPKINKCIHATSGIISLIFGGVAMVLGLYTGWFNWKIDGNNDIFILCYVAIVFGIGWSLLRPLITFVERMQSFIPR